MPLTSLLRLGFASNAQGADESASPSPQKKKQRNGQRSGKGSTSDKYGRAAEKNLKVRSLGQPNLHAGLSDAHVDPRQVFMGALGGVLGGLTAGADGSDAEGEEDGRADDAPSPSGSASSSSRAPAAKKAPKKRKTVVTIASSDQEDDAPAPPQPQPPQKRSRKQANPQRRVASDRIADEVLVGPASAAQTGAPPIASTSKAGADVPINMNDSDLSELEDNGPLPGARSRKGKGKAVESKSKKEKSAATSKSKKSDKKAKERKAPAPKPGDAPRGTDAEEDRITKLKVRWRYRRNTLSDLADARSLPHSAGSPLGGCLAASLHRDDRRRAHPRRLAPQGDPGRALERPRLARQGRQAPDFGASERHRRETLAREGDGRK